MRVTRVAKLERQAREHPCPVCGRSSHPPKATAARSGDRLPPDEWAGLAELLRVAAAPPCPRCGHIELDIGRLTDDQKRRTLALLRVLCDSPFGRGST